MSSEAENKNQSSDEEDEEKPPPESYQQDALHYDFYGEEDEDGPYKTREQKLEVLKQLDNGALCPWRLDEVYPGCDMTTREKLVQQIEEVELKKQIEYRELSESANSLDDNNKKPEEIKN